MRSEVTSAVWVSSDPLLLGAQRMIWEVMFIEAQTLKRRQ